MIRIKRREGFPKLGFQRFHQLDYTKHALQRLTDRNSGSLIIKPTFVQITDDNLSEMYIDGDSVEKVVVRLNYSRHKWLFLTIVVKDSGVKTVWLIDKHRKRWQETNVECVVETQLGNSVCNTNLVSH